MKVFLVWIQVGWFGKSYLDKNFFSLHHYALVMAENKEQAVKHAKEALMDYVEDIDRASVVNVLDVAELKCDGWLVLWKYNDQGEPELISDVGAFDNKSYSQEGDCGGSGYE